MSRLGINYHKSKPYGLNLSNHFILATSHFLTCKIEGNNFNFLGIPIGSNPRWIRTSKSLMENIKSILLSWKAKTLSRGGRLTLINSILSSLPIFMLCFFKAPVSVWKEIRGSRGNFFWAVRTLREKSIGLVRTKFLRVRVWVVFAWEGSRISTWRFYPNGNGDCWMIRRLFGLKFWELDMETSKTQLWMMICVHSRVQYQPDRETFYLSEEV